MKINYSKIGELSTSYVNGNISYVRDKAKKLNKVEFAILCSEIVALKDNIDIDEIAMKLAG